MTFGDHDDFHPRWSPDGERIAYISNEGGLPSLVVMETYGGKKRKIAVHPKTWKTPMVAVHLEVVDESGRHVPARVQGAASDGKFYAPLDSYSRIGVQGQHFFHTTGESTLWVPEGPLEADRDQGTGALARAGGDQGPEAGISIKIAVKRYVDLKTQGWHSGSTHVHMNYGGNYRNTLENLMFMSRSRGQDILNELVANKDNRILDWMYFEPGGSGAFDSNKDGRCLCW